MYLLLGIVVFISFTMVTHADEFENIEKDIEELRRKIEETQYIGKTLKTDIQDKDNKINLTSLQITETDEKIKVLSKDIRSLTKKIAKLEVSLSDLTEILLNRIVASYKSSRISKVSLLVTSSGFTDFLNRSKYIEAAQSHDRQVLTEVQLTKDEFGEQKLIRQEKKQEQETLFLLLEEQRKELDKQKAAKQSLLTQTQNDEAEYQRQLQQALAEKQAIEAALISGEKVGEVKAGEPIAVVGNTGAPACSTGAHLHFEIRKDNQWVNPADYLKSRGVLDSQNCSGNECPSSTNHGNGDWQWPLEGEVRITQFYGHTPYSYRYKYSGEIHTGIDMVSSSNVIRAPKDGTLYTSSQNCGGSSVIKIKYIEHGDGLISFYLHVQ